MTEQEKNNGTNTERQQNADNQQATRELPKNYRPALAEDVPEGRACGNCIFFNEAKQSEDGTRAYCDKWEDYVEGGYYCNAWQEKEQVEQGANSKMQTIAKIGDHEDSQVKTTESRKIEQRVNITEFEVREETNGMRFTGYAALFNSESEPLPFTEVIEAGAFKRSIDSRNDIKLLWNHNTSDVLGSTRAKTMKLYEDERGLRVEADLPNTTLGRDAAELLRRGDVDSMSFGFSVPSGGDEWSSDGKMRTLKSVRLHEVSIVAFPAYSETAGTTSVRALEAVAQRAEVSEDELADAMLKIEEGKTLTTDEGNLLTKVINSLSEIEEQETELVEDNGDMLALKKAKLKLLMDRI